MKNLFYTVSILGVLLIGCNETGINDDHSPTIQDTIHINISSLVSENEKTALQDTYYLKFGIAIPQYYLIKDNLALNLNGDDLIDTLIVLSPISLEDMEYSDCKIEIVPKRILVEIISYGKYSKIRNIYPNLISNIGGGLSKYNGLFATKDGFEIHHQAGSRYSWFYKSEFSTQYHDSIFLIRIEKVCSFEGTEKITEYLFNKKSLQGFDLMDTIQNNCYCDDAWLSLENNETF